MESDPFREVPTLTTLPAEARFMMYDSLIAPTGTLVIFAKYELTKNVDEQMIKLLHVNQRIRHEVQDYFYKNQTFQFRSFNAMDNFLDRIGPYYTSIVRNVEIGSWLASRHNFSEHFVPLMERLTGVENLTVLAPAKGFVTSWSKDAELGEKAIAILCASERLAAGSFWIRWRKYCYDGNMHFVPKDTHYPDEVETIIDRTPKGYTGPHFFAFRTTETQLAVRVDFSKDIETWKLLNSESSGRKNPIEISDDEGIDEEEPVMELKKTRAATRRCMEETN